jgi:hypothetical protein
MTAVLLGIVMGVGITPAFAVDGNPEIGLFELDGNPQDSPAGLPDDWEGLHYDCGDDPINDNPDGLNPPPPEDECGNSDRFTGIVNDPAGLSNFTGGGSKDIYDISRDPGEKGSVWLHIDGSEPDKNDITNGAAAAYQLLPSEQSQIWCLDEGVDPAEIVACDDPDAVDAQPLHREDDTIIYFMADRYTNNGDAFLGFWFFQEKIELTDVKQQGGFKFKGKHVYGDVLVLVEFPQGSNAEPVIKVYIWDPLDTGAPNVDENGQSIGPLEMIYNSVDLVGTSARCDGFGGKLACAITNDEGTASVPNPSWEYTPKGGTSLDDYPYETFYSGGINVSRLIGGGVCFASFMAESRSSRSETATLKDFVLGDFPLCTAEAETYIHAGSNSAPLPHTVIDLGSSVAVVGDTIHDSVVVKGEIIGSGDAPYPGLDDPDTTADETEVTFTLYDNDSCDGNVLQTSTGYLVPTATAGFSSAYSANFTLTQIGGHSYQATWGGDVNYPTGATSGCEPFYVIQPKLQINKVVNTCLSPATQDSGRFDLKYSADTDPLAWSIELTGAYDGINTGLFGVYPGTYVVGEDESSSSGASLDEYVSRFPPVGDCAGGTITLTGNQTGTCVIENIRKPHLIIEKQIIGAPPDGGQFGLQVNGVTIYDGQTLSGMTWDSGNVELNGDAGDGDWIRVRIDTGPLTGNPASFGLFKVGEVAGTGTNLANYQTSILCDDSLSTEATFATTGGSPRETGATISLSAGDVITCTITNIVQPTQAACPIQ